jgi:hypothetical protein
VVHWSDSTALSSPTGSNFNCRGSARNGGTKDEPNAVHLSLCGVHWLKYQRIVLYMEVYSGNNYAYENERS